MTIREGMVFGCMTPEEQKALRDARNAGATIEIYDGEWLTNENNYIVWSHAYRIAPTPVEPFRVDPIVWRVLDPKWRWITAGKTVVVWQPQPNIDLGFWNASRGMKLDGIIAPALIQRGTCPWQEAIAERPEGTP